MPKRTCSINGCEKKHYGRGYCSKHYQRWRTHGNAKTVLRNKPGTCKAKGCEKPSQTRTFCFPHYNQWRSGSDLSLLSPSDELFKCSLKGCARLLPMPYGEAKLCQRHYTVWQRHGDPRYKRATVVGVALCSIEGCGKVVRARGWCVGHYTRWERTGSPTTRLRGQVVDGCRICPTCNVDQPLSQWTKGECKSCARERTREYRERNPYQRVRVERICFNCKKTFMGNNRRTLHCSDECADGTLTMRNWKHMKARQLRTRVAFVEKFDRFEIFERDNWICGICGEKVNRDLKHPNPLSASLDHIIPISRGGEHSRQNAQCSHWVCNMRKGAKLLT